MLDRQKLIILGNGGHARVVAELARSLGAELRGFVGPREDTSEWLGDDDWLIGQEIAGVVLANGIGGIGDNGTRDAIFSKFSKRGFVFPPMVHPDARVAGDVHLGNGAQVMRGALVQAGTRVGSNAIVNTGAIVDHDCQLGRSVHVAPGATLSGGVRLGDLCHVGTGAVIIQNIEVGADAIVAAGALIIRSVAAGSRVCGVPGREMQ